MKDRRLTILIILIVTLSLVGIGIAFAAFSTTLTINGSASVEASSWDIVFEGADGSNTIGAPTLTGTAQEITHPTIKNNSTEISNYEVTLKSPGDSITYNFKVHNKGDYAANLTGLTIGNQDVFDGYVTDVGVLGFRLTTESSPLNSPNSWAYQHIYYKFYYTDNNTVVGRTPEKDCLEPGESANLSLRLTFSSTTETDSTVLPKSDVVLDYLGINAVYTQYENGLCYYDGGEREQVSNSEFINYDGVYYTYEGKSFIGTGVDNLILSENIISNKKYASANATECSDGSSPTGSGYNISCPEGTTPVFNNSPAEDAASAYCSGCRLMTYDEFVSWGCRTSGVGITKCIAKYSGSASTWWLAAYSPRAAGSVQSSGSYSSANLTSTYGVRPAVSIPSIATMTGAGTKTSPYVITVN